MPNPAKNRKVGGGVVSVALSYSYASLPDSSILALTTAGLNPAESELFSSSARRQTISAFAVRLTGSSEDGHFIQLASIQILSATQC